MVACYWSSLELVQVCSFSFACLVGQFGGGPAFFISVCLLVMAQFVGGPADLGNFVLGSNTVLYFNYFLSYNFQ